MNPKLSNPGFIGTIKIQHHHGYPHIEFETMEDYKTLCRAVRKMFKIKTTKKRIVKKYISKFLAETLVSYIKDMENESKT